MLTIIATLVIAATLIWKERQMSAAFDRLSASVDAAITRINSTTDDAALNALADKLDAAMPAGTASAPAGDVSLADGAPIDTTTEPAA